MPLEKLTELGSIIKSIRPENWSNLRWDDIPPQTLVIIFSTIGLYILIKVASKIKKLLITIFIIGAVVTLIYAGYFEYISKKVMGEDKIFSPAEMIHKAEDVARELEKKQAEKLKKLEDMP